MDDLPALRKGTAAEVQLAPYFGDDGAPVVIVILNDRVPSRFDRYSIDF